MRMLARMTSWVTLSRASPRNPLRSPLRTQRGGGRIAVPAGIRSRSTRVRAHACARPSPGPTPGCRGCRRLPCSRTRAAARLCRRAEAEPRRTSLLARHPTPARSRYGDFPAWRVRPGSYAATARLLRKIRRKTCAKFSTDRDDGRRSESCPMTMNNGGGNATFPPSAPCPRSVSTPVPIAVSALVEAAAQALLAALFVDERRLAALLAKIADGLLAVGRCRRGPSLGRLHLADVLGQRAGDGVGQREDLRGSEAGRLATTDAGELADDLRGHTPTPKRRREP